MMTNYPTTFALVEYHWGSSSDPHTTTWGNARAVFYNVDGTPDAWFDGVSECSGAGSVSGAYACYNGYYTARRSVPTDVVIRLGGSSLGGSLYRIEAQVCLEATGTAKTVRIQIAQVLNNWPTSPTYSRNTFRQAAAYMDLNLQPGQCQSVVRNFTFDADSMADQANIKIIAWAQTTAASGPANVYQAAIMNWPFQSLDCNQNGIPDDQDLANCDGSAWCRDCNGNGLPDVCDISQCDGSPSCSDCNSNGIPDGCEIGGGGLPDCNTNGIPDTCDIANCDGSPWCGDCNSNGIPDGCEIASGAAPDCNGNGIPDSCDIAGGQATDCDNNGVPDACQLVSTPDAILFPLDSDPGWATQGQWAYGHPTGGGTHGGDPNNGHTGPNVYGYNLSGDYPNNMTSRMYLTTTAINCAGLYGTELRFWRWLGLQNLDHAGIDVSSDGTNWVTVWEYPGGVSLVATAWTQMTYNIASVADNQQTVYVRWGMGTTDASLSYPGWNIDDVEIYGQRFAADCNVNGVLDSCEIAAGLAQDCNTNGILDTCEIARGLVADTDHNGVPDSCETGACCLADQSCIVGLQSACNGTYLGHGTTCTPGACAPPTGACCQADGTCTVVPASGCQAVGATYQGDGTTCTPNPCSPPKGACCVGQVCSWLDAAQCAAAGGTYHGPGTNCTPGLCACAGDGNCDGVINWRDIDYLIAAQNDNESAWTALFLPPGPSCAFQNLDTSGDGHVNWRDIDPFIALMNTTCD